MDHQAKQRKRSAVSSLRALALELGLNTSRRRADLSKDDFIALHAEVAIQRTTRSGAERLAWGVVGCGLVECGGVRVKGL